MKPDDGHSAEETPTRVGIGLIERGGSYLVRVRPRAEGSAMPGYWEFPGGKCEPGESPEAATARECFEEAGVAVRVGGLARRVVHRYPHGLVELNYYRCMLEDPEAGPTRGSGFHWIAAGDLPGLRFPEANGPVIAELAREAAG